MILVGHWRVLGWPVEPLRPFARLGVLPRACLRTLLPAQVELCHQMRLHDAKKLVLLLVLGKRLHSVLRLKEQRLPEAHWSLAACA